MFKLFTLIVIMLCCNNSSGFAMSNPELNYTNVYNCILYYDIKYPDIVYAQAILETGHFTSNICKKYNNIFGLYNSNIGDFYKFKCWTDSVKAYKDYVQRKYHPPTDYYQFLKALPYATDPLYIDKIKQILENDNLSTRRYTRS